jgi:rRNA-processing protein FCF1
MDKRELVNNAVVVDSNFILLPIQFRIDYIEDIVYLLEGATQFIIYQQVYNELKAKQKRFEEKGKNSKFQAQFEAGKRYLEMKKQEYHLSFINEVKGKDETTDEFLLRKAVSLKDIYHHIFLATNDYELRKKAKQSQISVIYLKQKQFISITRV